MKWHIPLIAVILALLFIGVAHKSLAMGREPNQKKVTCTYSGQFMHTANSKHEALKATSKACFETQLNLFEDQRGHLPDDDQAEDMIESCVNQTTCT